MPLATSARGVWPRGRRSTVETERALVAAVPHLHSKQIVLFVKLRQDESLDSLFWLESAKAGLMMPLNPIMGQAKACIAKAPLN
jgi:hypothetical protein